MANTGGTVKFSITGTAVGGVAGTAPLGAERVKPSTTTSGPLTAALGAHVFQGPTTTAKAPAKAAPTKGAAKTKAKGTIPVVENGKIVRKPADTRTAVLEFITNLSSEPVTATKTVHPDLLQQLATPHHLIGPTKKTITLPYTAAGVKGARGQFKITATVHDMINTVARKVLKDPKFTISDARTTKTQWDEITKAAAQRLDERKVAATESGGAPSAPEVATTGTVTGQQLYTAFVKSYSDTTATGLTTTDKTLTNPQVWDKWFAEAGLTSYTASQATAETAYKSLLKDAAAGAVKPATILQRQIASGATTLGKAQASLGGTALGGQSLTDYFVTTFTNMAHQYLVPMSQAAIQRWADTAAQSATGATQYERKENETDNFKEQYIIPTASQLYSTFATQIKKGVTTQTLLDPYAQMAAKTLGETTPETLGVTWANNPKWRVAVTGGKAATGKVQAPMSLTAWHQHLVSTPQYGWTKTDTAKQMHASVGQQLAQALGLRG